jgi:hypothetical protein
MLRKTSEGKKYSLRDAFNLGVETALSFEHKPLSDLIAYNQEAGALFYTHTIEKFRFFLDRIKERGGKIKEKSLVYSVFALYPSYRSEFIKGFIGGISLIVVDKESKK